ncbi:hypothetical protein [Streptomyces shenzhenensis]|uniref:Lipoprotein n=1 Tax=Streptomyces shenzhenensis TaxID=943815 RepID=A0A3M0IDG6_9ACTN|nr:hypothetical protein [Streptomyces shenzhenensis]RMB86090.1 hypothetical protein CTZ28_11400 [Streptomyces shenzhenensis]
MARAHTLAVVSFTLLAAVTGGGCSTGTTGSGAAHASAGTGSAPAPTESNPPGDIPDNQAFVAFRGSDFTVRVPEGWARSTQGAATVFTDKLNAVRISETTAAAAPTVGAVTNEVVPRLRGQVTKFAQPQVSQVGRKGGQAVLLRYQGDSAADPVTGKVVRDAFERYAFHRGGHEVDLTLSGPVNADNVDPWRIVSDSFTWR